MAFGGGGGEAVAFGGGGEVTFVVFDVDGEVTFVVFVVFAAEGDKAGVR